MTGYPGEDFRGKAGAVGGRVSVALGAAGRSVWDERAGHAVWSGRAGPGGWLPIRAVASGIDAGTVRFGGIR
jgi:hypothetical protein